MTELCTEIREKGSEDGIKCSEQILLLCTDGGGDHKISKISVQISLICLFLQLDLDYLITMRTCPTQIWVNPAERVMCILNYALQHCALEREKMGKNYENKMRNKNTMNGVCQILERCPEFEEHFSNSMEPVKSLKKRFQNMKIKEDYIECA